MRRGWDGDLFEFAKIEGFAGEGDGNVAKFGEIGSIGDTEEEEAWELVASERNGGDLEGNGAVGEEFVGDGKLVVSQ